MVGTELGTSARAVCTFNCWIFPPTRPWDFCWGCGSLNAFLKCFWTYFFTCGDMMSWYKQGRKKTPGLLAWVGGLFLPSLILFVIITCSGGFSSTFCEALFSLLQLGASKCTCLYCVVLSSIYTAGQRDCWDCIELEGYWGQDLALVFWRGQGQGLTLLLGSLTSTQWYTMMPLGSS